jgi:hypothetical protein
MRKVLSTHRLLAGAQALATSAMIALTANAHATAPEAGPALLCRGAIAAMESATRIPEAFLSAIGRVESGRTLSNGLTAPWPWTVNAAGEGHFYESKAEAIAAVKQFQASGIRSLDVGCLQVNIMYHPDAFASLDQAFDPAVNVAYAARLLMSLHDQMGSWPRAAAAYHSQTPSIGHAYQERVLAVWSEPDKENPARAASPPPAAPRKAEAATKKEPEHPAATASLPPAGTFTRNLRLPAAPNALGRSLASYRSMPVQIASRAPVGVIAKY